jgi:hypothetical protein
MSDIEPAATSNSPPPSRFELPEDVENYILIAPKFCKKTNDLLQTMHPNIEIICEEREFMYIVDQNSDRLIHPKTNVVRKMINSAINKDFLKIRVGRNELKQIPKYYYNEDTGFKTYDKFADGNYHIYSDDLEAGFLKRQDLIKLNIGVNELKVNLTYNQKLNYFIEMLQLYSESFERSEYKKYDKYKIFIDRLKTYLQSSGGRRLIRRQSKRKNKSTKRTTRRRGTKKRAHKKK